MNEAALAKALALHQAGKLGDCEALYDDALRANPSDPDALHYLGLLHYQRGHLSSAGLLIGRAIEMRPDYAKAHVNLGTVQRASGNATAAMASYRRALEIEPRSPNAQFNLGMILRGLARFDDSIRAFRDAARLAPDNPAYWQAFAESFGRATVEGDPEGVREDLLRCVRHERVDPTPLRRTLIHLACRAPAMSALLERLTGEAAVEAAVEADDQSLGRAATEALSDPLLLALMEAIPLAEPRLESVQRLARRHLMVRVESAEGEDSLDDGERTVLCALAHQGDATGYILATEPAERTKVDTLMGDLETEGAGALARPERLVAAAAYGRLDDLASAVDLARGLDRVANPGLREVLIRQFEDMTPGTIHGSASPERPQSRWRRVPAVVSDTLRMAMTGLFPWLQSEARQWTDEPRILVIECATGRPAITSALRFRQGTVTALDPVPANLAYGARQAERLNVPNVEFRRGGLNDLGAAEGPFDVIECVGPLFREPDAAKAIETLRPLLAPGGLLRLALFSATGRAAVDPARVRTAKAGLADDLEGLREARRQILALPEDDPARAVVRMGGFHGAEACRHLLFGGGEPRYRIPRIAGLLAASNMRFLGFEFLDWSKSLRYRQRFPEDERATDLDLWDRFEKDVPDCFREMYRFWVCLD